MTENASTVKKISPGMYVFALLSFIPLVGILLGIASLVYGIAQRKRGGLVVSGMGLAGILFSFALYSYLYRQMIHPTGDFAKSQTQLIQTFTLPDLVKRLEYYKIQNKEYPKQLEALGPEVKSRVELNAMSTLGTIYYELSTDGNYYYLLALGQDGEAFTDDDILPEIPDAELANIGLRKKPLH